MDTAAACDDARVPWIALALAAIAGGFVAFLARPLRPDPRERAELEQAVTAVDRELAANLELTSMFDQTKQAVTLENGEFARHRATLERSAGATGAAVSALYERIPETESAMERRGPANSLRPEDRGLIERWEGDARDAQRSLRASLGERPLGGWAAVSARLRGRLARR